MIEEPAFLKLSAEEIQRWRALPETDAFFFLLMRIRHDLANEALMAAAEGNPAQGPAASCQTMDLVMGYMGKGGEPRTIGRAAPAEVDDFVDPASPSHWRTRAP